jgi:hypothetical protein
MTLAEALALDRAARARSGSIDCDNIDGGVIPPPPKLIRPLEESGGPIIGDDAPHRHNPSFEDPRERFEPHVGVVTMDAQARRARAGAKAEKARIRRERERRNRIAAEVTAESKMEHKVAKARMRPKAAFESDHNEVTAKDEERIALKRERREAYDVHVHEQTVAETKKSTRTLRKQVPHKPAVGVGLPKPEGIRTAESRAQSAQERAANAVMAAVCTPDCDTTETLR